MSNHKDNTHNKPLKDFLGKKNQEHQGMDDFEKEAMEGFDMLKDEKEIVDLKNALDQKIYGEVFSEKKKSRGVYWYAAAGLLLVIGFSVYFILGTGAVKENTLAIHKEEPSKDAKGDEIQKIITDESEKTKNLEYKQPERHAKTAPSDVESRKGKAGKKEKEYDLQEESVSARNDAFANQGAGSGGVAISAPKPQSQAVIVAEPAMEAGDGVKQAKAEALKDEDKKAVAAETMLAMESKDDRTTEKASKKTYRARPEESPVATYNAPAVAGAGAATMDIAGFLCYYEGGDGVLQRDVKDKLKDNDLIQKFDATLFINEKKKVEKAEITNAYSLSKEQQEKIINVLKKLDKFKFNIKPESNKLTEYKLVFRP